VAKKMNRQKHRSLKERISGRYRSVKSRIIEHVNVPYLLFGAIIAVIIGLFVLGIKFPFADESMSAVVDNRVISYVSLYHGIVNVTINSKTLESSTWKVNLNGYASDGIVNLDVDVNAKDFSIMKITQTLNMPSKPNTINFLDKAAGCSVGDAVTVDVYIDPYDPWSIKYDAIMNNFTQKFGGSAFISYRILSTYSYKYISEDPASYAYTALKYYQCAKEEAYFQQFKNCVIQKYGEDKEFLNETELISCVKQSGGDEGEIKSCTDGSAVLSGLATDQRFAETFLGTATTPMMVMDCRYSTYPLFADYAFCYLYPDKEQCEE